MLAKPPNTSLLVTTLLAVALLALLCAVIATTSPALPTEAAAQSKPAVTGQTLYSKIAAGLHYNGGEAMPFGVSIGTLWHLASKFSCY